MISNSDIETLASIGELEASRNEILNARASFTDNGGGFIAEYLMSAGLFRKLDPSDPAQIGAYNHAIEVADRLGLFTESSIKGMVSSMLRLDPYTGEPLRK